MKIKAAVFDWDGTLYNLFPIDTLNQALTEFGIETITLAKLRENLSAPTLEETFMRAGLSPETALAAKDRYFAISASYQPQPEIFPDVLDTLRWLHDRSVNAYIVSIRDEDDLRDLLDTHKLTPLIAGIKGNAIPTTRISFLLQVLADLGIAKDEMVFVDDSADMLQTARVVGCYRVGSARGLSSHARLTKAGADATFHELSSFQRFLNLLERKNPPPPNRNYP